ncbi:MAG: hypothetical protein R3Y05_01295 [bacterium]
MNIDVKDLISNLNKMRINSSSINREVTIRCLESIKTKANINLLQAEDVTSEEKQIIMNGWKFITEGNATVLYNETSVEKLGADEPVSIAAFIEFGIGIVGKGTYDGDEDGYEYNKKPTIAKSKAAAQGKEDSWWYGGFTQGNAAEAFLYKAYREFVNEGTYKRIYNEVVKTKNGW